MRFGCFSDGGNANFDPVNAGAPTVTDAKRAISAVETWQMCESCKRAEKAMSNEQTYNIVTSGELSAGRDQDAAVAAFSQMFKIEPEKAEPYFGGEPKVLRKGLDSEQLKAYETALEKIGLQFEVKPNEKAPSVPSSLTMEAIHEEPAAEEGSTLLCPKCRTLQPKTDTCESCGIIYEKYRAASANKQKMEAQAARKPKSRWW